MTTAAEIMVSPWSLASTFVVSRVAMADPQACREFREADGKPEFTTDGTSVNTTSGWREMKVGLFSKRESGEPATADEWADRTFPAPTSRVASCAIEKSHRFGRRWKQ